MACPVNHPLFHAFVFLIGILVVLSRYVRAEAPLPPLDDFAFGLAAAGASSNVDLTGSDWTETVLSLTGGVGAGLLLLLGRRRSAKSRLVGYRRSGAALPGESPMSQELAWKHGMSMEGKAIQGQSAM